MFPGLTVYVLFALATALAGVAAGWWLRCRGMERQESTVDKGEIRRAQELLNCLQKLASNVALDLGEHNTRVEELNVELQSDKLHEPAKILNVVTRLVDANKAMQGRLDQAEDRLREQVRLVEAHAAEARTDALTLVGNRRAFETDIAQCLADFHRTGHVFSLAMIDLDKFKRFNDAYGHQAGDEVLRGTGRVLRRILRESDSVARYGGEEFALIFNGATIADVQRALTRLRKAIANTAFEFSGGKHRVTISIGAAQVICGEGLESIVQRADAAMYASKEAGGNCGHWHDGQKILPIRDEETKLAPAPIEPPEAVVAPKPAEPVVAAETPVVEEPRLEELADDLPELLNRTAFCQHVRSRVAEWKRGGPTVSLVLVQIDHFENLSGLYGARLRDLLVASLARVVFAGVREMDPVARYSASCLAFLLPKAQLVDAIRVANRVREAVNQVTLSVGSTKVGFTVSIGLIEAGSADDVAALFRKADMALDAGRQRGGDCVFHHDGERCQLATAMAEVKR
ncbi:MAG: GGDEF domain-containing protein [Thermoguttaceae bacterium]